MTQHNNTLYLAVIISLLFGGCSDDPLPQMNETVTEDAFVGNSNRQDMGSSPADSSISTTQDATENTVDADLTEVNWAQSVDDLIAEMGLITSEDDGNTGVSIGPPSEPVEEGNFICTTQPMSQTAKFNEYVASQANSNSLWVGALIQGQALNSGMLTEAQAPRRPLTISISLDNLNGPSSVELAEPSLSNYREGIQSLLAAGVSGSQPAQITYSTETIHSQSHLDLFLGADVTSGNVDVEASFDFSRSEVRSRVLVNFIQAYYTVDLDTPGRASQFFAPLTSTESIGAAFGGEDAHAPLYVSSITYGRRVVFTAESTATASELKAALDFAYDGALTNVDVDSRLSHEEILEESNIKAFVLGGNAEDAVAVVNGLEGIQAFIAQGGTFSPESPGAPIAYKLNHLSDNSAARLSLTTDYDKVVCERVRQNVMVTLMGITPFNGQNNARTYGTIKTESVATTGGVTASRFLFNVRKEDRISMDENQEWQPTNSGVSVTLPAVASLDANASNSGIRINVALKEHDVAAQDDEANANILLSAAEGWRRGCGQGEDFIVNASGNRQNYRVRMCLRPMPD